MPRKVRTYSRITEEALRLLGKRIKLGRKSRHMSEIDLAARAGMARSTLQKIEKGDPLVEIGLVFEAAVLTGVQLFEPDTAALSARVEQTDDKLALLPHAIREPRTDVKDDF